jgi:Fic family protein
VKSEQFSEGAPGRLVEARQPDGRRCLAFVPDPLPPRLTFDLELVRVLSEADRALAELKTVGRLLSNPYLLIGPFVRREAVLSSRIEGTQTTLAELYAFEVGQQLPLPAFETAAPESDIREVRNYVVALEYGLERTRSLPVGRWLIRDLHQRLMSGERGERARPGEFRTEQNFIGAPGNTLDEASFVPPPPLQMQEAIEALERYIQTDDAYPPLLRLAFIHYQFEAIHPFVDGNGRIGRLLITLLLVNWNLISLPLLYLSAFFERHRDTYYDLLRAVSERGAWQDWVRFFLRGVAEQAQDAVQRATRLQDLQRAWRERLSESRSVLVLQLAESLFNAPVLTIPRAQQLLDVTYPSAKRNIEKLVSAGILEQVGEERYGKAYLAPEILRILR